MLECILGCISCQRQLKLWSNGIFLFFAFLPILRFVMINYFHSEEEPDFYMEPSDTISNKQTPQLCAKQSENGLPLERGSWRKNKWPGLETSSKPFFSLCLGRGWGTSNSRLQFLYLLSQQPWDFGKRGEIFSLSWRIMKPTEVILSSFSWQASEKDGKRH